ncbi:MAG: hypothetical protein ABR577_11105 [Pyrinomonadaceae bacterium]
MITEITINCFARCTREKTKGEVLSLEFTIDYACPLRARYSEKHLRAWGSLESIYTRLMTDTQTSPDADKLRFVENARVEIETMRNEAARCRTCPACLPQSASNEAESLRCLGRINYPVEAQFEKFLADRTQLFLDTLDTEDQPRLLRILVDAESPFDGEGTKELRRVTTPQNLRFFELRLPIRLTREAAHITTDNLFDMLAGFRSEDAPRTTFAREISGAAIADYYDFLDLLLRNDLSASEQTRLHARGQSYAQYLRLLTALERAEALHSRVLLD